MGMVGVHKKVFDIGIKKYILEKEYQKNPGKFWGAKLGRIKVI